MNFNYRSIKLDWELIFTIGLFVFLFIYLIIRANTVFYTNDEVVTKWAYMVSWNPIPFSGYIDANNHFINSFLGGLFVRLFNSDAIWIIRLPNILAFPLFFWSIYNLKVFFQNKINYYWFLTSLTFSAFVIEYFGLARGYGISMALLLFGLQQMLLFFKSMRIKSFVLALLTWTFLVYANLTLIPFTLVAFFLFTIFLWKNKKRWWIIAIALSMIPVVYAIKYSFYLKEVGKLYYGGQEGFFENTIHSLTPYLWNSKNLILDILLILLFLFILFTFIRNLVLSKNIFELKMIFSLFFVLSVANILLQNWVLNINFPEDRAALYLVIFFFGAICFTFDYWKVKFVGYPFIVFTIGLFIYHFNFERSLFYGEEHFDKELLSKIPEEVKGIPTSTGGSMWLMEKEAIRFYKLPFYSLQQAESPNDTLQDFIVNTYTKRPDILKRYSPVYEDKISGIVLFKRKEFLPRKLTSQNTVKIQEGAMYQNLFVNHVDRASFLRCKGRLTNMSMYKEAIMMFEANDTLRNERIDYYGVSLNQNCPINDKGELFFDFTFTMYKYPKNVKIIVYLYNPKQDLYGGEMNLDVYEIID